MYVGRYGMVAARMWNSLALVLLTLSLGCMGCGAADPAEAPPAAELGQELAAPAASAACEVVFTPASDIADLVEGATAQWSEATGCNVHTGPSGIPVSYVEQILDPKGNPQCGETHRLRDESGAILGVDFIHISDNLADRCHLHARDVLHELGHGLAPHRGHATEGLMALAWNSVDYVDETARAFVCSELGC